MMQKILSVLLIAPAIVVAFSSQAPASNAAAATMKPSTMLFAAGDDEGDKKQKGGLFSGVSNFFAELDAFMDDASARRLGRCASFYGKRKSSFYGEDDKMKKTSEGYDPTGL